ncbi:MAG: hypothetical protein N2746_00760 [Deltaproteobacteria bacterium]|nr:hypothetical protein [Deltaproteobacteria bacterium]
MYSPVELEHEQTQIERALNELGIRLINANTPQAKGRIERRFRFFQDRLIKEMRLLDIDNYTEANKFLEEEFLPWCNRRYTQKVESLHEAIRGNKDLDLIFSVKNARKVNKENTVRFCGRIYQILPFNGISGFCGRWVEICELLDGRIEILWGDKELSYLEGRSKE